MSKIPGLFTGSTAITLACVLLAGEVAGQTAPDRFEPASMPDAAPPGPVHACAEWEESVGIILNYGWQNVDTVTKMSTDHQLYIQVDNPIALGFYQKFLNDNGIPQDNIHFIMIPTTYGWMRDCGPWFIWNGKKELCIVNNSCWHDTYPEDDRFPGQFAEQYGYKYYAPSPKIYGEGGNFYPNAYGTAFSTSWVYGDNGEKSKQLTDSLFEQWLGIERYITVPPYTLSHVDTCTKPANPETLIVAQWPEGYWKHPLGEAIAAYFETLESPWGRPYVIHRIPMLPMPGIEFGPYLNCLVANETLFVPVTQTPADRIALDVFRAAYPGYEVVGIDHHHSGWGASLHCATKLIMKRAVIRIYPYPPGDTEGTGAGCEVRAEVISPSGAALLPGYPVIHWTETGALHFQDVVMSSTGQADEYSAEIPAQAQGTDISFYIEARDDGGLTAVYPLVAPEGMMTFRVRADTEAPALSRFLPTRSASASAGPPSIRTLCKDDMVTPEVRVEYSVNGVPQPDVVLRREELCYWYSGFLAGAAASGDLIRYRLHATDKALSANEAALPAVGEFICPVTGPGESIGIVDLSLRPCTGPFLLDTLGDLGLPHHHYRTWPVSFDEHDLWFICLGEFPYNHILSSQQASDVVAALNARKSIYLEGGDTWSVDPVKFQLGPWFGVQPNMGGWALDDVVGVPGALLDGFKLKYADEIEDLRIDRIKSIAPAELFLQANAVGGGGLAVAYDSFRYSSIASSTPLGALVDGHWPETRKEILLRYLEFFGEDEVRLIATGAARPGSTVQVRIEAKAGEEYLLAASWAEDYLPLAHGICRLSPDHLFVLDRGVVPDSEVVEYALSIPPDPGLVGMEVHLQAMTGQVATLPRVAEFTNREILTVVE